MSLTAMTSPTLTFQVTISASVRPSPTSGSRYSAISELHRPVDRVQDLVEIGDEVLLHAGRRVGNVEAADPQHGRLQGVESLLGDARSDLGAHAQVDVSLVGHDQAAGA